MAHSGHDSSSAAPAPASAARECRARGSGGVISEAAARLWADTLEWYSQKCELNEEDLAQNAQNRLFKHLGQAREEDETRLAGRRAR